MNVLTGTAIAELLVWTPYALGCMRSSGTGGQYLFSELARRGSIPILLEEITTPPSASSPSATTTTNTTDNNVDQGAVVGGQMLVSSCEVDVIDNEEEELRIPFKKANLTSPPLPAADEIIPLTIHLSLTKYINVNSDDHLQHFTRFQSLPFGVHAMVVVHLYFDRDVGGSCDSDGDREGSLAAMLDTATRYVRLLDPPSSITILLLPSYNNIPLMAASSQPPPPPSLSTLSIIPSEMFSKCCRMTSFRIVCPREEEEEERVECSGTDVDDTTPILKKKQNIGPQHMMGCTNLSNPLNLGYLRFATDASSSFLSDCASLTTIDLSPLRNVTDIGHSFLKGCVSLSNIDLAPFRHSLQTIGMCFLGHCTALTSLDTSPLLKVERIGVDFLMCCQKLKSVNLQVFEHLSLVPAGFLRGCNALEDVSLAPLHNVTRIGDGFLSSCWQIKILDLSPLVNLYAIGPSFLEKCVHLQEIKGMGVALHRLEVIPWRFLSGCRNLYYGVDFSQLENVRDIHGLFLNGCSALPEVDFTGFVRVKTILKEGFMWACSGVPIFDFRPLGDVIIEDRPLAMGNLGRGGTATSTVPFLEACFPCEVLLAHNHHPSLMAAVEDFKDKVTVSPPPQDDVLLNNC